MVSPELLARCKRGDRLAFEELVRATHRRVYSLAYRLVGDRFEAEDVAQDAYLRMFRGLAGFREEAAFETWMHRIVTNAALNLLRRRGRFGELLDEGDTPDTPVLDRTEALSPADLIRLHGTLREPRPEQGVRPGAHVRIRPRALTVLGR